MSGGDLIRRAVVATLVAGCAVASAPSATLSVASGRLAPLTRSAHEVAAALPACTAGPAPTCYSAVQLRQAYGVVGEDSGPGAGAGATIALLDSFGSPTIAADLAAFDRAMGLPTASLTIIAPVGPIPAWNGSADRVGWAVETTLDVELAHAMAPAARLVLVETPVSETEGMAGIPQMIGAINYITAHHIANVISMSWGASEPTIGPPARIVALHPPLANAVAHGITLIASSGDTGATDYESNMIDLFPSRTVGWPASDPSVTAVGGTYVQLRGNTRTDAVWHDSIGASGGGISSAFLRPSYQNPLAGLIGPRRGLPDISMSAAVSPGGVAIFHSNFGARIGSGIWDVVGGTSEAAPEFAGVVARAIGVRIAKHRVPLGLINPWLYSVLPSPAAVGIADIVAGNNSWSFVNSNGKPYTVKGWAARPGYDLASGVGTVGNAKTFAAALAARP